MQAQLIGGPGTLVSEQVELPAAPVGEVVFLDNLQPADEVCVHKLVIDQMENGSGSEA
jgi:hypothetical protein